MYAQPQAPDRVDELARAMIDTNAEGGATRDALLGLGFSARELDTLGTEAEQRARTLFLRKTAAEACEAVQDELARVDVEGANRAVLVRISAADICHLWQGARDGGATGTIEATLRLQQAFGDQAVGLGQSAIAQRQEHTGEAR